MRRRHRHARRMLSSLGALQQRHEQCRHDDDLTPPKKRSKALWGALVVGALMLIF